MSDGEEAAFQILHNIHALDRPSPPRGLQKWGNGWRQEIQGVRFDVKKYREDRHGIHAEVIVSRIVDGQRERIAWDLSLNLGSDRTRDAFAKKCERVFSEFIYGWRQAIDQLCEQVIVAARAGEPTGSLVDAPIDQSGPSYLVHPLLPRNQTSIIYGDGGTGKSTLGLTIALAVVTGQQVPGFGVCKPGMPALFLDWEEDAQSHAKRLHRLCRGFDIPQSEAKTLFYRRCVARISDDIETIQEIVADNHIGFVVIDSIGNAFGGDMNEAATVIEGMSSVRGLGVTVLGIHHINSVSAQGGGKARPMGSVYFWNGARCLWEVKGATEDWGPHRIALLNHKMNADKKQRPIGLEFHDTADGRILVSGFDPRDDADMSQHLSLPQRIAAVLRQRGRASVADLVEELNSSPETVRSALARHKEMFYNEQDAAGGKAHIWHVHGKYGG